MSAKLLYVSTMRAIRGGLRRVGLLQQWDKAAKANRIWRWSRSLLAVYDAADLVALDVPWWTFRAASKVDHFLASRANTRVFEWGSGASTVWLAKRTGGGTVVSVEHDSSWAIDVQKLVPDNVVVRWLPPCPTKIESASIPSKKPGFSGLDFSSYVQAIDDEGGQFDLIVIDGRAREACLSRAIKRLAPDGLIVFDNSNRRRYRKALRAVQSPLVVHTTHGLTPCVPYPTTTSLIGASRW